ncbi:hypothetical protein [Streptomyces sp. NPDC002547]
MASDDDPDAGKDLSDIVPTMTVSWDKPPSFNLDPSGSSSGDPATDVVPDSIPIKFEAATVRATENTLLAESRNAVSNYEALREKVDSAAHNDFWGPPHPDAPVAAINPGATPSPSGGSGPSLEDLERKDQETLAQIGEEFAQHINPAMQKALAMQSNALELLGSYIAMINTSGQTYSQVDRAARFPEPPGSVTG